MTSYKCLSCGKYTCGRGICRTNGIVWFIHNDGRPPGLHPDLYEEYQAGKLGNTLFSKNNIDELNKEYWETR